MSLRRPVAGLPRGSRRGSVIIIVMWTCLGLVALTLYFANSMSSELRAAENRATAIEARQAVQGGIRYAAYVLTNFSANGALPNITTDYKAEALPVGDAQFWFIGRDYGQSGTLVAPVVTEPVFGLVDESSKLNLNRVTRAMLMELPNMTDDLADAIIAWRTTSNSPTGSSDSDSLYSGMNPPRRNKSGPFESVDELRLVSGATLDLLLGEDTNRNGALDPNEDDGEGSAPRDNQDGQLQPGLFEYFTVYSRLPNTRSDGTARINIATPAGRQRLVAVMTTKGIEARRAQAIVAAANAYVNPNGGAPGQGNNGGRGGQAPGGGQGGGTEFTSVAEFMVRTRMTADEFTLIHADIVAGTGAALQGLVNVNTASVTVLTCIPGIGADNAATLVAYRSAHPDALTSMGWLTQVLSNAAIIRAGPFITDQSFQYTADVAAIGRLGRGYCREKVVFDMSTGTPRILFHQDLTSYGWALGTQARQNLKGTQQL
jgi:type II secretory pathway component PulK